MKHALLSFLFTGILCAEDWPQFLGPRRDGTYQGKALPKWPAAGLKVLWKQDVGAGFAGPAVDNGKLFLHHRLVDKEVLDCRDATTGKIIWRSSSPAGYEDQFGFDDGPRAVPTVSGARVFTLGANGLIKSTDVRTGATLWRLDAKKKFAAGQGFFGFACSPMVNGPNLIINIGGPKAGIIALDIDTGKLRWTATRLVVLNGNSDFSIGRPLYHRIDTCFYINRWGNWWYLFINGSSHFVIVVGG